MFNEKRVVVIGAGASGLCAAKHALAHGYDVTVYEQSNQVGGTWVYTDRIGTDEHGLPIHTSMYKDLVTNLPIETMGFPGFNFPNRGRSYVSSDEVLEFFVSYAKHYNIIEKVMFEHHVVRVKPTNNDKWEVIVRNLKNDVHETKEFDYVLVCNGHNSAINMPNFTGSKSFVGKQLHSHSYRQPDAYAGENVLVIGAGPSGRDLVYNVAPKARNVFLSTHGNVSADIFPRNVVVKPDVDELKSNSVVFVDGSEESIDTILYCTGYRYEFPFLSVDTGICRLEEYHIHPLYKHCINIAHPTMALIGIQMTAYTTLIYDMQVKLCFRFWNKEVSMPSKQEMLLDTNHEIELQWTRLNNRRAHLLGDRQAEYLQQLADAGHMMSLPDVYMRIYYDVSTLRASYPNSYRNYNYRIIDDINFERIPLVI